MAQVAVYTNLELPGILDFIKNCVADSTGRQEPTVFVSLNRLQSFKFGTSKEGIFIKVNFVGAADVYRTQKTLQYLCQKLESLSILILLKLTEIKFILTESRCEIIKLIYNIQLFSKMLKLQKLMDESSQLKKSYFLFTNMVQKQSQLLQMKNTNQFHSIQSQITKIQNLSKTISYIRIQFYQLQCSIINLDSALSLHVRLCGKMSKEISYTLKNKGGYYADFSLIAQDMYHLSAQILDCFISNGWNKSQVQASKILIKQETEIKMQKIKENLEESISQSHSYLKYINNTQNPKLLKNQVKTQVNLAEISNLLDDINVLAQSNQTDIDENILNQKNQKIYKKILEQKLYETQQKLDTFTPEQQFNPVNIKFIKPENIKILHDFYTTDQVLSYQFQPPNDFKEFYQQMQYLQMKIQKNMFSQLVKKCFQVCKNAFYNFIELQQFAKSLTLPFECSELYINKFGKLLYKFSTQNPDFEFYLNDYIVYQWHKQVTNYDSYKFVQLNREEIFKFPCFKGDLVNKNDISIVVFQGICILFLAGFRQLKQSEGFPDLVFIK